MPSARPLTAPIDLDDCVTFGSGGSRLLAVFTDRDQVADFENAHTLQTTGAELVRLLPDDAGIIINPQRPDQLALTPEGVRRMATMVEHLMSQRSAEAAAPKASAPRRRLFGRRRT